MDQISFPFLRLPTELQDGIVSCVWKYSDLQSLCIVSKHISDIATPSLYYEVNLTNTDKSCIFEKISILLIKPANLRFVRVLNATSRMRPEESLLMDQLLPQLRKDFLKEIGFVSINLGDFPMPYQIRYLWYNQKNLKNLKLGTHIVPWLDKFSKELQPGRSAILKFFTVLEICDGHFIQPPQSTQTKMLWPLENLDLRVFRKLIFSAGAVDYSTFSTLNTLFASGCFVNLTELRFRYIRNLDQNLMLAHMPSLKLLEVRYCKFQGTRLPLELADDIRLSDLTYDCRSDVEKITPLLTRAIGLEYLALSYDILEDTSTPETQRDLICAITHKDTLRELYLLHQIVALDSNLEATLWDFFRPTKKAE
ncbi:hypothetical protein MMC31_000340 [Peltigera leucophlebia]|nr:hypothetical protein [Peltigera leucophlebia]